MPLPPITLDGVPLPRLWTRQLPDSARDVSMLGLGRFLVAFNAGSRALLLDGKLEHERWIELGARGEDYVWPRAAISPYGDRLAVSSRQALSVGDVAGGLKHRMRCRPWPSFAGSACRFTADGRLVWWVCPGSDEDRLTLVDACSGATVAEAGLGTSDCHYSLEAPQAGDWILVEAAAGQEECILSAARLEDGAIRLQRLPAHDRVFGSFAPSGASFVTGPHDEDLVLVHSFPEGRELGGIDLGAELAAYETFQGDEKDAVDYRALFLGEERILVKSRFGRVLVMDRATMKLLGDAWPEGQAIRAYDARGKLAKAPGDVVDYIGEIVDLWPAERGLLVRYRNDELAIHDVAALERLHLAGDTKLYLIGYSAPSGDYVEVDPDSDDLMALRDASFIVEQLAQWSSRFGIAWKLMLEGETIGNITQGVPDGALVRYLAQMRSATTLDEARAPEILRRYASRNDEGPPVDSAADQPPGAPSPDPKGVPQRRPWWKLW